MQRWGSHKSPWYTDLKKRPYEVLRQDLTVDVVVVGAGITGLVTATLLARAGKKVAVVTQGEVGEGTTGSSTGHLTQVQDSNFGDLINRFGEQEIHKVVDSSGEAISLIEKLTQDFNISCGFSRIPGFRYSQSQEDLSLLMSEVKLAQMLGLSAHELNDNPLPFLVAGAIQFDNQAMFDPLRFVVGLADEFSKSSKLLFEGSRVLAVEDGHPGRVHTEFGSVTAKEIVLATHTPIGVYLSIHTRVAPYFSYVMGVKIKGKPTNGLYWDTSHPYYYLRPFSQGSDLWIVGGRDHKTGQQASTLEKYLELEDFIRDHLDVENISFYWGSELFEPVDGLPYIGKIPFTSSILTGTGYSGNGLTFGALAGILISDLILGRKNDYSEIYDPSRVKPVASAPSFIKENINVAKWMVTDRLTHHEMSEIKLIPPNEGRVVDVSGKRLAIYRNENGRIHALSSTCTHLGCTVHWNTAEKTWDCPCHGGRFRPAGEAFQGPPIKDLEDIKLNTEENPDAREPVTESTPAPGFSPMPELGVDSTSY